MPRIRSSFFTLSDLVTKRQKILYFSFFYEEKNMFLFVSLETEEGKEDEEERERICVSVTTLLLFTVTINNSIVLFYLIPTFFY